MCHRILGTRRFLGVILHRFKRAWPKWISRPLPLQPRLRKIWQKDRTFPIALLSRRRDCVSIYLKSNVCLSQLHFLKNWRAHFHFFFPSPSQEDVSESRAGISHRRPKCVVPWRSVLLFLSLIGAIWSGDFWGVLLPQSGHCGRAFRQVQNAWGATDHPGSQLALFPAGRRPCH